MWPSMTMSHGQRLTCPSRKESACRLSTTREWHAGRMHWGRGPISPQSCRQRAVQTPRGPSARGGWWPSLDPPPPLSSLVPGPAFAPQPLPLSASLSLALRRKVDVRCVPRPGGGGCFAEAGGCSLHALPPTAPGCGLQLPLSSCIPPFKPTPPSSPHTFLLATPAPPPFWFVIPLRVPATRGTQCILEAREGGSVVGSGLPQARPRVGRGRLGSPKGGPRRGAARQRKEQPPWEVGS